MADTDGTAVKWGMRMEQNLWELRENCHIEETLCKKREELAIFADAIGYEVIVLAGHIHRRAVPFILYNCS